MTQHLTHCGLPEGVTRWQFLGLIQTARRQLGFTKGAVAYLKVAISCTQDEDFKAGRICAFWTSVTKIAGRAELDRRQVARIEADLIDREFLGKSASDHSRRGGSRKEGAIGHEFGINLAPLINRASEIQSAARKAMFEENESDRLRAQIRKLFGDIRKLRMDGACEAASNVLPNSRPSTIQCFSRLKQVAEALEAVWKDFSAEASRGEKSHQCDISPSLNTVKEKKSKTCRSAEAVDQRPIATRPAQAALLAGRELSEMIALYAEGLDPGRPPTWPAIEVAARDRAYQLGVTTSLWQRFCDELGSSQTALCLLVADRNSERGGRFQVRNPAAAFVGMARQQARQGAVLSALLGELINAARVNDNAG
ncbi:helix-turn-helix domain-containing protein [Sulfitobacter sp.]|uniref:helix-turn-helix domain-containing protein n=1 Tax=Sulfitobacter sp. TaxID=1903071 RepID=UPI003EF41C1A